MQNVNMAVSSTSKLTINKHLTGMREKHKDSVIQTKMRQVVSYYWFYYTHYAILHSYREIIQDCVCVIHISVLKFYFFAACSFALSNFRQWAVICPPFWQLKHTIPPFLFDLGEFHLTINTINLNHKNNIRIINIETKYMPTEREGHTYSLHNPPNHYSHLWRPCFQCLCLMELGTWQSGGDFLVLAPKLWNSLPNSSVPFCQRVKPLFFLFCFVFPQ